LYKILLVGYFFLPVPLPYSYNSYLQLYYTRVLSEVHGKKVAKSQKITKQGKSLIKGRPCGPQHSDKALLEITTRLFNTVLQKRYFLFLKKN